MAELTPMMQQYLKTKEEYPDCILFYRLGDFYEMFFEDALTVTKELEITLTGKSCGLEERAPMCGVPYHAAEGYLNKLVSRGYKVAICEQTEQPQKGKSLVNRDVIRVVTPGTIMENSMLAEDRNNYIASVYIYDNQASVCFCDISTGSMQATVIDSSNFENNLKSEIYKYMPKEIIINTQILSLKWLTDYLKNIIHCSVELIDESEYNDFVVDETVKKQFDGKSFDTQMSRCLWQLLNYLSDTQKVGVEKLSTVDSYQQDEQNSFIKLSYTTTSNLELFETIRSKEKRGSLLWVLDNTKTSFGKRMLRKVLSAPLMDKNEIDMRLDAVEYFNNNPMIRMDAQTHLKNIQDNY